MGREPPSRQRRVALAGVDVDLAVRVFVVTVDDVLSGECVVALERLIGRVSVGVDGQRGLHVLCGNRPLAASAAVSHQEDWRLVALVGTTSVGFQPTRARPPVALAAFDSDYCESLPLP